MKRSQKNIYISRLIYDDLHGELSSREREILNVWLSDSKNCEFYTKIKNSDYLYRDLLKLQYVNTERSYAALVNKKRALKRKTILYYLTGLVAISVIGIFILGLYNRNNHIQTIKDDSSVPSQVDLATAILTTSDGKILYFRDTLTQLNALNMTNEDTHIVTTDNTPSYSLESTHKDNNIHEKYNLLATSHQGNLTITLEDGTKVYVNACTKLRYPDTFNKETRSVMLEGEAFFEVAKDANRPFIVETKMAKVTVLGTHFNLNCMDSTCVATLIEGSVCVHTHNADSVIIHPGEQAKVDQNHSLSVSQVNVNYFTAWKENKFAFENRSLKDIMEYLSLWYNIDYKFCDKELENILFTTTISRYSTIEQVLNILTLTNECHYMVDENNILLITR